MRALVVDDDAPTLRLLKLLLSRWGYDVVQAVDGLEAWASLSGPDIPRLVVLDWMMPAMDGIELCRRIREQDGDEAYTYIIILTAKDRKSDMQDGFEAGADDYITKPFDHAELRLRLTAGERIVTLKNELSAKIGELEEALAHVQRLQGLLPICMHCARVQDDEKVWKNLEAYVQEHAGTKFSHGLCDSCMKLYYPDVVAED